jgi:S-adenosylmethionine:tRNA ribosyltransferase-isomerase
MRLEDFDYDLPESLIAQHPCKERDNARMMVVDRATQDITHDYFFNLPQYLKRGDVIVINDSKVTPARLIGKKETGGTIEILLLSKISGDEAPHPVWDVMLKPSRRIQPGTRLYFEENGEAVVGGRISDKKWQITFILQTDFDQFLSRYGRAPLPPYIKRKPDSTQENDDLLSYQTIYARLAGSVAAPTAGLHFSQRVLDRLDEKGVRLAPVTLHVGYGTFSPIEAEHVENHRMDEECFEISQDTADIINHAEHVITVGTTSTRVIESVADETGKVSPVSSRTDLFIYPGYRFKRVNSLLTNFHLPKSSLFLLVCSFAGRELMQEAYRQAVENRYRFYSYGDCMLIL